VTLPASVCGDEVLAELGRGTTGIVYRARHPVVKPDRLVALEVPSLGAGPEAAVRLARYHNEWNALRVLTWEPHPVIPTLLNVGCDLGGQNNHYVRELVEGATLEQGVASGAVGLRDGLRVISAVAGAVQRMHARGIAHRNLRAGNVLLTADGEPKLIGFGHVGPLAGTDRLPRGMSGVSPEVDVLALRGCLLGSVPRCIRLSRRRSKPFWSRGPCRAPAGLRRHSVVHLKRSSRPNLRAWCQGRNFEFLGIPGVHPLGSRGRRTTRCTRPATRLTALVAWRNIPRGPAGERGRSAP